MRIGTINRQQSPVAPTARLAAAADTVAAATASPCPQTWVEDATRGSRTLANPPTTPRDEAILLLHAAAEIEHSLMVQYLYAAYSVGDPLPDDDPRAAKVELIRYLLLHIAREEMAHLGSVQNLLRVLGSSLHLDREQSPFTSELLPFRFKLEPLSLGSLAKYVIAESPRPLPPDDVLSAAEKARIQNEVTVLAKASNDGICVGHVGDIFTRLLFLFRPPANAADADKHLSDSDFLVGTGEFQAQWNDWGYDPKRRTFGPAGTAVGVDGEPSLVEHFAQATPAEVRLKATEALEKIAAQGEGADIPAEALESHFEWFWLLFRTFEEVSVMTGGMPVWPVPVNPNTTLAPATPITSRKMVDSGMEAHLEAGRITHPRSRRWAQLFNLRYRLLLAQFHHFLRHDEARYDNRGDRTARGYLLLGVFNEMRRIRKIARKLAQMPQADPEDFRRAGAPFELPYTTQIPDGERERWARHFDTSRAATQLVTAMLTDATDGTDGFLHDLLAQDTIDQQRMTTLVQGQPLPMPSQEFPKVVRILEEAMRGFTIQGVPGNAPRHLSFWQRQPRGSDAPGATDGFVNTKVGTPILHRNPDGSFDPAQSPLIRRLKGDGVGQMPRERPPVPQSRIDYVEDWVRRNAPDSNPAYPGLSPEREPNSEAVFVPIPNNPTFNADIRPLFRQSDIDCMLLFSDFDLSKYDDVKTNAARISTALTMGGMPPDGKWSDAKLALFKRWMDTGTPES